MRKRLLAAVLSASLGLAISATAGAAPLPHGMGLIAPPRTTQFNTAITSSMAGLPVGVDLTRYAMPVGDQGQLGSCASWATVYGAMGYWENRDRRVTPGGGEPMYVYSQISHGRDNGSTIEQPLAIAKTQGVDTRRDYLQGDFNFTSQPSTHERQSAGHWKDSGYRDMTPTQANIESALASGKPVVVGINVYYDFWSNQNIDVNGVYPMLGPGNRTYEGDHAVVALGYNPTGLVIENSWGTKWGRRGYATLRWSWVLQHVLQATVVGDLS
jgi:C1A family cysteine protease